MTKIFLFLIFSAFAQSEFNKILFSIGSNSWTLRDRQVYQAVLGEVFQKKMLSAFSKDPENDFLLSRLSFKEAAVFELTPATAVKISDNNFLSLLLFNPNIQ